MKYKYVGTIPTVCVVEGRLIQVNKGEVVELNAPISSEFVAEKKKKVVSLSPKVTPKKNKVEKNAPRTETSSMGE
jgi:hypothetical protein